MEQLKQLLTAAGIAYKENEPLAVHCTCLLYTSPSPRDS